MTAFWYAVGKEVRSKEHYGVVSDPRRPCTLEGCTGIQVRVHWRDGKYTWACTKGLVDRGTHLEIPA